MVRSRRALCVTLLVLLLAGVAAYLVARLYLTSGKVRRQVASRLEKAFGAHFTVEAAEIGMAGNTSLKGLRLYEVDAEPNAEPWASSEEVTADISAWDVVRGQDNPEHITLTGPTVTLRFNPSGDLLTRIPSLPGGKGTSLPAIQIEQGQVVLKQEGRPDLVVGGLTARLQPENGKLRLTGSIDDPYWKEWSLEGLIDAENSGFTATLKTLRASITTEMLGGLPFIPPEVLREVVASGTMGIAFTFQYAPRTGPPHYRVVIDPDGAVVKLPSLPFQAERVRGRVVVEDGLVRLENVVGQALGGQVEASGEVDFRGQAIRAQLALKARGLEVARLPGEWGWPEQLPKASGKLSGQANLFVVHDGKPHTSGSGEAVVTGVKIGGQLAEPIQLRLKPTGTGFRFQHEGGPGPSHRPENQKNPESLTILTSPLPPAGESVAGPGLVLAREFMNWIGQGLREVARQGARQSQALRSWLNKPPRQPDQAPTCLEFNLGMENVDLAELIKGLKVQIPMAVTGRLTFQVEVRLPMDSLRDLKAYRVRGTATVTQLKLAGIELERVQAIIELRNSVFHVQELKGHFPRKGGTFMGSLRLGLVPAGDPGVQLQKGASEGPATVAPSSGPGGKFALRFEEVDLGLIGREVLALPIAVAGHASGKVVGDFTVGTSVRGPEIQAQLDLSAPRLRLQNLPAERLTGTISYRQGQGAYHLKGGLLGGTFDLEGRWPAGPIPSGPEPAPSPTRGATGSGHLRLLGADLALLWPVLNLGERMPAWHGQLEVQLEFSHGTQEYYFQGLGLFLLRGLGWDTTEIAREIRGQILIGDGMVQLRDLTGALGEGTLGGQLHLNWRHPERSWSSLNLYRVEAARLLAPWPALASALKGPVEVRLRASLGREWRGTADVNLGRGTLWGVEIVDWRLPLSFSFSPAQGRGQVDISETSAQLAHGRLTGRASLGFGGGSRLEGQIRFNNVDLHNLMLQSTDLTQMGNGQVTGRIEFSGTNIRSPADLKANVEAFFSQTQAFLFPVLAQMAPFVAPGQGASRFQSGELRGWLSGGLFRVQRLGLSGPTLDLFGAGTITLDGRLNLEVVTSTRNLGINPAVLRLFGMRLPTIGPVPVGLVLQVSDYLSNRSIRLNVTGTLRHPVIQVEPLSMLTEEAVRFFLNRYNVPIP